MKAVLVSVSLQTRIVVPDDFNPDELNDKDYETIRDKAYPQFFEAMRINGVGDSLDECKEDTECPYGTFDMDELQNDETESQI